MKNLEPRHRPTGMENCGIYYTDNLIPHYCIDGKDVSAAEFFEFLDEADLENKCADMWRTYFESLNTLPLAPGSK